ncbi:MAG: hypothetical protein JXA30_13025 [Deltaproteobacteria bacterium]|nr:hypothetical protein [Deltaproteobacteria bacterium]
MHLNNAIIFGFLCVLCVTAWPLPALAGGAEYPAEGGQGLGRGGANMARADSVWVLSRNPALLSDLWGSQLSIGGNLGFSRPCFYPSGGFGWGEDSGGGVFVLGEDASPIYLDAEPRSRGGPVGGELVDLETDYDSEPYPEGCAVWDTTFSPTIGLATRIDEKLGIGIALMPPEYAMMPQYGNSDGTIDTPEGKRPNPLRYFGSMLSTTYFGLVSGVGYKALPWLRVGLGFRWTMLIVDTKQWDNSLDNRSPATDQLAEVFFQDLFIPGIIGSIHLVPIDSLDIAIGYKWEDRIKSARSKADIITNVWGYGKPFQYNSPTAGATVVPTVSPTTNHNIPLTIDVPPITPPQLSFAIRYADRIRPRPKTYTGLNKWNDSVRDSLSDENWDIEFNAVYYFNSVKDRMTITFNQDQQLDYALVAVTGESEKQTVFAGECPSGDSSDKNRSGCPERAVSIDEYRGRNQLSLRLGGDYNLIPGVLALRAGLSWEDRGVDVRYAHPMYSYPFMRFGIHAGVTWRIDERTDFSFSYAHFFQETIDLAINDSANGGLPDRFRTQGDRRLSDDAFRKQYHIIVDGDGVSQYRRFGQQYYHNAGSHYLNLDVIGGSLARHF